MTPPPPPPVLQPERFVVVWRETPTPGARLRTYTNADDVPLLYALDELTPAPALVLTTQSSVEHYLTSSSTDPVAIPLNLARDVLGWEPTLP